MFIGISIFVGCAKEDEADKTNVGTLTYPAASFSYSGNDQPSPVIVKFINTSQYSNAYQWSFGDGIYSSDFSPSHKYINSSQYEKSFLVILTAKDTISGLSNTRSQPVRILPGN